MRVKSKKLLCAAALAVGCFFCSGVEFALAEDITIELDGAVLSLPIAPIVDNGYTLVPIRVISENMGATVDYEAPTREIIIKKESKRIELQVGSADAKVDGNAVTLQMPAREISGSTLVPLRFIGESLGATIDWIGPQQKVVIQSAQEIPVYSMDAKGIEENVLTNINKQRTELGLAELVLVPEMQQMARAHSKDMAENDFFAHTSPSKGAIAKRAQTAGLPTPAENISSGYIEGQSAFEGWLSDDKQRQNMLDTNQRFVGVGVYYNSQGRMYLTADFLAGDGFFVGSHEISASEDQVNVKGYATAEAKSITVYRVENPDDKVYLSKQTVDITINSDGSFRQTISLWEKGYFVIMIGNDRMIAHNA